MGKQLSCCFESRPKSEDADEERKEKKKLGVANYDSEDDPMGNHRYKQEFTNISNINPNPDETINNIDANEDLSFSDIGDDGSFDKKEIIVHKIHNSKVVKQNNSITPIPFKLSKTIYFKISINGLDLKCDNLDDYGSVIKPYLELYVENLDISTIRMNEKDLNVSLMNESENMSSNSKSFLKAASVISGLGDDNQGFKEKNYTFKFTKTYKISESQSFGMIFFSVKNENGNFTSTLTPNITIGNTFIPIKSMINKYFNNEFDGYLEIFSNETKLAGVLKLSIQVSEKNLEAAEDFNLKMNFANQNQIDLQDFGDLEIDFSKFYTENKFLHYEFLEEKAIEKYFVSNFKYKEQQIKEVEDLKLKSLSSEFVNVKDSFKLSDIGKDQLYNIYSQAFNNKNMFLLYTFIVILNKICLTETDLGYEFIYDNLLSKIDSKKIKDIKDDKEVTLDNFIYNVPKFSLYNCYILKYYFKFILHYLKFYRNHKNGIKRNNKYFDDIIIINKLSESIKAINNNFKTDSTLSEGYKRESISCLILCYNILTELATVTKDPSQVKSKDDQFKKNLEEFTNTYKNCMEILQKRLSFLRPVEKFGINSQVCSLITRIFRKVFQMLLTPIADPKKLEHTSKSIKVHHKDLITVIRVIFL